MQWLCSLFVIGAWVAVQTGLPQRAPVAHAVAVSTADVCHSWKASERERTASPNGVDAAHTDDLHALALMTWDPASPQHNTDVASLSPRSGTTRTAPSALAARAAVHATTTTSSTPGDELPADRVELQNGSKLQGRVVYQDEAVLILRDGSKERTIPMKDVKLVVSRLGHQREAIERWLESKPEETQSVRDLAQYCKRVGLHDDALLFQRFILCSAPEDEEARLALGHARRANGWSERSAGKWTDWRKIESMRSSWKTPWELRSSHYRLRTNLPMSDAVRALLDLECLYFAFYDLLGAEMMLRETVEPLEAHIHADAESFPVAYVGRSAYFDAGIDRLVVDASKGIQRGLLFHEAVHQLLFNTAVEAASSTGDLPAWLDEGLAEYMSLSMSGVASRATLDTEAIARNHFERHAAALESIELERLLVFGTDDFLTPQSELKYAASYTFVHFCLHGQGEKFRRRFFDFMRGAYKGQGSPTHFKDALATPEDELERAWRAHVARGGDRR